MTVPSAETTIEPEIPDAVGAEIESWRRVFASAQPGNERDLLRRSSVELWRIIAINKLIILKQTDLSNRPSWTRSTTLR